MTSVLIRKDTGACREEYGENGVRLSPAKECEALLGAIRSMRRQKKKKKIFFPRPFGGSKALLTLWFGTASLQSCERRNSCCFECVGLGYSDPRECNAHSKPEKLSPVLTG